ncbi:MAG: ATP-binding protein [Elusimicrobiota bacterium]
MMLESALFRWAFEESPAARAGLDSEGVIRSWSRGAEEFLAVPAKEALGRPVAEFFSAPGDWTRAKEAALSGEVLRNFEATLSCKDGSHRRTFVSLWKLSEGSGFLAQFAPAVGDLDAPGQPEAVREALLRMERFAALGRMAAAFAHEMRTPLHVISSTAEFSLEFLSPEAKVKESLEMIARNAELAAQSIRSLLDFAKTGRARPVEASLQEVVRSAAKAVEKSSMSRGVSLELRLGELPPILIDPQQVRAVVLSLLVNAVEAVAEGGKVLVSVEAEAGGGVLLSVQDDGPGMTAEVLSRAGGLFFTTKETGTGLGLYLAKRVLAEHGASISFESAPSRGTRALIRFPPSAR